jgi:hypothetical protein
MVSPSWTNHSERQLFTPLFFHQMVDDGTRSPSDHYRVVSTMVANGALYIANAPCGAICAFGLPAGKSHT